MLGMRNRSKRMVATWQNDWSKDVKVRGRELSVEFELDDVAIENSGIGHYEYWGARCFDAGSDSIEEANIVNLTVFSERLNAYVKPSDKLKTLIEDKIYKSGFMDELNETLEFDEDYDD